MKVVKPTNYNECNKNLQFSENDSLLQFKSNLVLSSTRAFFRQLHRNSFPSSSINVAAETSLVPNFHARQQRRASASHAPWLVGGSATEGGRPSSRVSPCRGNPCAPRFGASHATAASGRRQGIPSCARLEGGVRRLGGGGAAVIKAQGGQATGLDSVSCQPVTVSRGRLGATKRDPLKMFA